jgi:ubiquinone/menaquinone biosynthesis C-methylase UbiE
MGSVNCDIEKPSVKVRNFVRCDAYQLPFKGNAFPIVYASHILEHLDYPQQSLKEMKRVTTKIVVIKVPNASFYKLSEDKQHLYSWNKYTLKHLLRKHFSRVKVEDRWRKRMSRRIFKDKLSSLKWIILSLFWKKEQLTATCWLERLERQVLQKP